MVSLLTVVKLRTATDGGGSKQERCFKTGYLQSFKTRRFSFCHGRQNQTVAPCRALFYNRIR
ncbi:hypothetical protein DWQ65_03985 [Treponema phagedenis]|nr:hypothetical protein DWQ65_03985 [Treponema phagedenis]